MQVSIYRYNPDVDEAPQMRDMALELPRAKTSWCLTCWSA